jgi:hypothetical protein
LIWKVKLKITITIITIIIINKFKKIVIIIEEKLCGDMWRLDGCLGAGHTPCAYMRLGPALVLATPLRTRDAWVLPLC